MNDHENQECLACLTFAGASSPDEVYRDEQVVAVLAHHALNPGHLVVVTREHVRTALDLDSGLLTHLILVGRRLAAQLHQALPCASSMLVFNIEAPAQTLFHTHLHVIPRRDGDAMHYKFGEQTTAAERAELAARLRPSLCEPDPL